MKDIKIPEQMNNMEDVNKVNTSTQCEGCIFGERIKQQNDSDICIECYNHHDDVELIKISNVLGSSDGEKYEFASRHMIMFDSEDNVEKKYNTDSWLLYKVKSDTSNVLPIIERVTDESKCDGYLIINKNKLKHNSVLKDIEDATLQQFADKIIDNYIFNFNFISSHMVLPDDETLHKWGTMFKKQTFMG